MKICNRGGHTQASTGACASLNELTEDRKVVARVNELLREVGNEVYNVTPPESYAYPDELNYGINKTNSINPELFFSIHFNSYNGANGSEICVYPNTPLCNNLGNRVLSNLADLGFKSRGLKSRTDLSELTSINCPSMIIEVCFVQEPDASLYRSLGVEKIARAIANGIDSRVSLEDKPKTPIYYVKYVIVYDDGAEIDKGYALTIHNSLKHRKEDTHLLTSYEYDTNCCGDFRGEHIILVGGGASNKFRYGTKLGGANRDETAYLVTEYIKNNL